MFSESSFPKKVHTFPIRIYAADAAELSDETLYQQAYSAVSEERKHKTDRLRFSRDRCLSLGAELLLITALSEHGIHTPSLSFEYGKWGKPHLPAYPDIHFNISHSGTYVICAISPCPVGCDIEKHKNDIPDIAQRFFSAEEYAYILRQPSADAQKKEFYRLWTLKESFMKATGMGLKLGLNQFRITIHENEIAVQEKIDTKHWYFQEYTIDEQYSCSACSLTPHFEKEVKILSLKTILEELT